MGKIAPFLLLLAGCDTDVVQHHPPVAITYAMLPGYRVLCESSFFWIGLPMFYDPVIAYQKQKFDCRLVKEN